MKKKTGEKVIPLAISIVLLLIALLTVTVNERLSGASEAAQRRSVGESCEEAGFSKNLPDAEAYKSPTEHETRLEEAAGTGVSVLELLPEYRVYFSEAMVGSDGEGPDWIEYVNAGTQDVCLKGWTVVDGASSHILPDITLCAGEYLLLYADGEGAGVHLSFTLAVSDTVVLCDADGNEVDSFLCIEAGKGQSIIRADKPYEVRYEAINTPTPGLENSLAAYLSLQGEADGEQQLSAHGSMILSGEERIVLNPDAEKGAIEKLSFEANGRLYQAEVYLPASYDESLLYDLMILLPGRDGDPSTWLEVYNGGGTGRQVLDTVIGDGYAYPFVCVSTDCFNRIGISSARAMETYFEALIDAAADRYSVYGSGEKNARLHRSICGFSYSADIILNYILCSERMLALVSQFGVFSSCSCAGYSEDWIQDLSRASAEHTVRKLAVSGGVVGDAERSFRMRTYAAGESAEQNGLVKKLYSWSYDANHEQGMDNAFISLWNCAQVMCAAPLSQSACGHGRIGDVMCAADN